MRLYPSLAALLLAACAATQPPQPAPPPAPAAAEASAFSRAADRLYWAWLDTIPVGAFGGPIGVSLGYHQYDGKLPDLSAAGIQRYAKLLDDGITQLQSSAPERLSPTERDDRAALLRMLKTARFDLAVRRMPFRNPMTYVGALDLLNYIARDYAPATERARAVIAVCNGAHALLAAGRENLEPSLPRTFIETALVQVKGLDGFARKDVPAAFAALTDEEVKRTLAGALDGLRRDLGEYQAFLVERRAQASDDFALGPERFREMLATLEGVDVDLDALERAGREDLARNRAALEAVAREIAPGRPLAEVVRATDEDKPPPEGVLALATQQMRALRGFLESTGLTRIPSDEEAEAREAPPFMRVNTAFLRSAGVFEPKRLPSFYLISPPDPSWPEAAQKAYVPSRGQLLFITAHEVWPGHFLHRLYRAGYPTRITKTASGYSTSEGWAHYTEELMWDHGAAGKDPRLHLAQIEEALLRDVRSLSALGLHCRGMSVAESERMFRVEAFADEKTAHQQALRGTFDPGYLNYTLGKLMIRKLAEDLHRKEGDRFRLAAFHEAFLQHGWETIPEIRAALLGPGGGPPL